MYKCKECDGEFEELEISKTTWLHADENGNLTPSISEADNQELFAYCPLCGELVVDAPTDAEAKLQLERIRL